jgi:hypothetical protein
VKNMNVMNMLRDGAALVGLTLVLATACSRDGSDQAVTTTTNAPATSDAPTSATQAPTTREPTTVVQSTTAPTPTTCSEIPLIPNSDAIAGNVVATGTDCARAEALIRAVSKEDRVEPMTKNGFTCNVTPGPSDQLQRYYWRCTSGPITVTWTKT